MTDPRILARDLDILAAAVEWANEPPRTAPAFDPAAIDPAAIYEVGGACIHGANLAALHRAIHGDAPPQPESPEAAALRAAVLAWTEGR